MKAASEKQLKYATDLVSEMTARVVKFEDRGKGENVKYERMFLNLINEETNAARVIDMISNFSSATYGHVQGIESLEVQIKK